MWDQSFALCGVLTCLSRLKNIITKSLKICGLKSYKHNFILLESMDKTSLDTSSGSLFVRDSLTLSGGCPRHVITYHCSAWHNGTSTYVIT